MRQAGTGAGAPAVQPFGYTGEQLDAVTGLYHLRARQYDPGTGRFLSVDPAADVASVPSRSTYAYGENNPVLLTDPGGQCPICVVILVGALAGGGSYVLGVGVSNAAQGKGVSLEGFNPVDLGLSMGAGAVTGGTAPYLSTLGRVGYGAVAGFDATVWSMNAGGRTDPVEIIVGTAFGGAGGAFDSGPGFTGLVRGTVSGGFLQAAQTEFQRWWDRLFGQRASQAFDATTSQK